MAASALGRSHASITPRGGSKPHPFIFQFINHATFIFCYSRSDEYSVPAECAIKIFKTTLNEFKNRDRYIKGDYRFKGRFGTANSRKLVKLWAEKEMHNLKRFGGRGDMRETRL